jgi:PPOX class probable FMN-dependent enzyme
MDLGFRVTTVHELEAIVGIPEPRAANKARTSLHPLDREWLAAASLLFMATSDEEGNLDASPKGDPPGMVRVLDDTTIAIPERPGNRRVDGYRNIIENPHVGIIALIPGRDDTLRITGRASIVRDAPFMADMQVKGHRPLLALVVEIDEVFYHCSKAFLRSKAWHPESWTPDAAPRRAVISHAVERPDDSIELLDEYYGPAYEERIYQT